MELIKELRELQETILQEEKERYEREKKAFEEGVGYSIGYAYINSHDIDNVFFEDYEQTPDGIIEMCNETKELIDKLTEKWEYKNVKAYPYVKETRDDDWYYNDIFLGFTINWYYLRSEDFTKERAKRRFSDEVSDRVYEKAKTILDKEQVYYKRNVDCFLLEKFMNEQVDFDFLVEATYRTCSI